MPDRDAVPDPGAAYERTRLAWRRTVLSLAVVALLGARLAVPHGVAGAVLAGFALAGWPVLAAWAAVRMRALARHGPPGPTRHGPPRPTRHGPPGSAGHGPDGPGPGRLLIYALGAAAYALGGLGLVIATLG